MIGSDFLVKSCTHKNQFERSLPLGQVSKSKKILDLRREHVDRRSGDESADETVSEKGCYHPQP